MLMDSLKRLLCFSVILGSVSVFAQDVPLEFKAAYFYPTSHRFRQIYPGGGPIYGFELSAQAWKQLYPWFSANYFSKSGHSIISGAPFSVDGDRTSIRFVPLALGLKFVQPINSALDFYFGLGALATYVQMKDHASYVIQTSNRWGAGGIAKIGTFVNLYKGLFIDLAVDYSYIKINFKNPGGDTITRHAADLSGFSFGCGIGYRFGCRSESKKCPSPCCVPMPSFDSSQIPDDSENSESFSDSEQVVDQGIEEEVMRS